MKINLLFTAFALMTALALLSFGGQAESLDITRIIQGTVKETKSDFIEIVDEQNSNMVRIAINPNTVYDNVQKWTELKAGDKVQVEYQQGHDKNIATMITKVETEDEEDS